MSTSFLVRDKGLAGACRDGDDVGSRPLRCGLLPLLMNGITDGSFVCLRIGEVVPFDMFEAGAIRVSREMAVPALVFADGAPNNVGCDPNF